MKYLLQLINKIKAWLQKTPAKTLSKEIPVQASRDDIYYHESGHTVAAKLFEDVFTIKFVTMDEEYSKQFDPYSKAGLHGSRIIKGNTGSVMDDNKMALIMLAGFCTDLINNYNKNIPDELFTRTRIHKVLSEFKYSGDMEHVYKLTYYTVCPFSHIHYIDYLVKSTRFLCDLLLTDVIWSMVDAVRNELVLSANQTLTAQQLELLFDQHGFTEWLSKSGNLIKTLEQSLFPSLAI